MLRPPDNRLTRLLHRLGNRYIAHQVGLESAALAFYLIFALFPFLIVISALLGMLRLNMEGAVELLGNLVPEDVARILTRFLLYAGGAPNPRLLVPSLVLSFYFPMRATNSLMFSVRRAYRLGAPRSVLIQTLKNLLYTVVLMVTVVLTAVLMTVSNHILAFAVENLRLPPAAAHLWAALRFPVTAVVAYFALFFLYVLAQDSRKGWQELWPGTLAALGGWMTASWLYALYVNNIAHYSLIYGSIGTVMVLLIWLNLSSMTLILGAELNGALMSRRRERLGAERRESP